MRRTSGGQWVALASALWLGCSAVDSQTADGTEAELGGTDAPTGTGASDAGSEGGSATDGAGEGVDESADSGGVEGCDPTSLTDVVFAQTAADPASTSLDVLVGSDAPAQSIVIFVHGGGWVMGDKGSHASNPSFAEHFAERQEILVPINYRLVDDPDNPGVTYAEQAADVAAAIAWTVDNATSFCGDPARVHLIGYSAGAHLVALVATDPDYLGAHGLQPDVLSTVVSLDVDAYDIPWAIDNAAANGYPAAAMNLPNIFGSDPAQQRDASPIEHIGTAAVSPSLVIAVLDQNGVIQTLSPAVSQRYVDALGTAGNEAQYFEAADDTHASLASDFGTPGDIVTGVVATFLDAH